MLVCCGKGETETLKEWFTTRSERCQWKVNVVEYNSKLAEEHASTIETGATRSGLFLFDTSPLLKATMPMLSQLKMSVQPSVCRALDIGSGSGRDAILLATAGFHITAIDRSEKAMQRWLRLADRQNCRNNCRGIVCNVKHEGDLARAVGGMQFHVVTICRHLHRPLQELADLLVPGGLLLIHTFMEGNTHPTDRASVLAYGELADAARHGGLEVLRDDVLAIDDERLLSFFVARRAYVRGAVG